MEKAKANNVQIHLPVDFVTGDKFAEAAQVGVERLITSVVYSVFGCQHSRHPTCLFVNVLLPR